MLLHYVAFFLLQCISCNKNMKQFIEHSYGFKVRNNTYRKGGVKNKNTLKVKGPQSDVENYVSHMHLPWEEMYLSSIFMNLNPITIKFALNNHFLPMELNKSRNVQKGKVSNKYQLMKSLCMKSCIMILSTK